MRLILTRVLFCLALTSNNSLASDQFPGTPVSPLAAHERTCCICTTGNSPSWQVPIFKLGCNHWLSRQAGCDVKQAVSAWSSVAEAAASCKNGEVKLGYVGHGDEGINERLTYIYVSQLLDPNGLGASVDFDNTACRTHGDAIGEKRLIDTLPIAPGKYIRITGAQSVSVGEFDHVLPGLLQVNAVVDSRENTPEYPPCSKVLNASCLNIQEGNQVYCDNKDNSYAVLTCSNVSDPYRYETNSDGTETVSLRWAKTYTVFEKDLFAPPKTHIDLSTYECTGLSTLLRFTLRKSAEGATYMEMDRPNSSSKTRGALLKADGYQEIFSFPDFDIGHVNIFSSRADLSTGMLFTTSKDFVMGAYNNCKKVDQSRSESTPSAAPTQALLVPEQLSTLKTVKNVFGTQKP